MKKRFLSLFWSLVITLTAAMLWGIQGCGGGGAGTGSSDDGSLTGVLSGTVKEPVQLTPLQGVKITLSARGVKGNARTLEVTSDAQGNYVISDIPQGSYLAAIPRVQ